MKTLYRQSAAVILAVNLALVGCASTTTVLQDWVGAPESELVRGWVEPKRVTETASGRKVLEYDEERFLTVPDRLSDSPGQLATLDYGEHRHLVPNALRGFRGGRHCRISLRGQRLRPQQAALSGPDHGAGHAIPKKGSKPHLPRREVFHDLQRATPQGEHLRFAVDALALRPPQVSHPVGAVFQTLRDEVFQLKRYMGLRNRLRWGRPSARPPSRSSR